MFWRKAVLFALTPFVFVQGHWNPPNEGPQLATWALVPLWMEGGGYASVLHLNNTRNNDFPLRLEIRGQDGGWAGSREVFLKPREWRRVEIAEVREQAGPQPQRGALWVRHAGHQQDLGIQMTVSGPRGVFDVPASEPVQYESSRLRGLVDPAAAQARILLVNSQDTMRKVTVEMSSGPQVVEHLTHSVPAGETLEIDISAKQLRGSGLVAVEAASDGLPGEVSGGILVRRNDGRASFSPLQDPALLRSSRLVSAAVYGAGYVGYRHPLLVRNASGEKIAVSIETQWHSDQGRDRSLEELALVAGEGLSLAVERFLPRNASIDWAALDVTWSGPPDALQAAFSSMGPSGTRVANPLADPLEQRRKVSNYIVGQGGRFDTRVEIRNPDPVPRKVVLHLFLEDGREHSFGTVEIPADSVHEVDFWKLQQEAVLPAGEWKGQLIWFPVKRPYSLSGRALITDLASGSAASFSCQQCGIWVPDSFTIAFQLLDSPVVIGDREEVTGKMVYVDCGDRNQSFESGDEPADFYESSDTSVATVNNSGEVTAVGPGTATIRGYRLEEYEICQLSTCTTVSFVTEQLVSSEPFTVEEPTLECQSPVERGKQATCTVENHGDAPITGWEFEAGNSRYPREMTENDLDFEWSGIMVTGGTVSVTVGGENLSDEIEVQARGESFMMETQAAVEKANGSSGELTISEPPNSTDKEIGRFHLFLEPDYRVSVIPDRGPNHDFKFVKNLGDQSFYHWTIPQGLKNTNAEFHQMQCGNYDSQTNQGFISGANLKQNTIYHESASTANSHYHQYKVSNEAPATSAGVAVEALVGLPDVTFNQFNEVLSDALAEKIAAILSAADSEPCDGEVNRDGSKNCTFEGFVNYRPYKPCP